MAMGSKWSSVVALTLTLGMATAALAGPGGRRPEGGVKARVEKMKERLALSDEQAQKIEAILNEARTQGEADRSQARQRRRDVHEKIQSVLTQEQRAKAAQQRQERRSHP